MADGKYKGLESSYINTIKNQRGTSVSSKVIFTSEATNPNVQLFDACNIDWSGYKIGDTYITYTGDLIENLGNVASNPNIDVDETYNSITVGNTTYMLMFDKETGILSLSKDIYNAITLKDVTTGLSQSCEYKSSPLSNNTSISLHATASKPVASYTGWSPSSNATVDNTLFTGLTYTATGKYGPVLNGTSTITYSWSMSVTEVQQGTHSQASDTATVTVKYTFDRYAYWCGVNTELVTNGNGLTKSSSLHTPTPNRIYFNDSQFNGIAKYIYFAIKGTGNHVFYITSGTNDTQVAGGIVEIGTIQEYGNVDYTLYRSDEKQTGSCNVRIA